MKRPSPEAHHRHQRHPEPGDLPSPSDRCGRPMGVAVKCVVKKTSCPRCSSCALPCCHCPAFDVFDKYHLDQHTANRAALQCHTTSNPVECLPFGRSLVGSARLGAPTGSSDTAKSDFVDSSLDSACFSAATSKRCISPHLDSRGLASLPSHLVRSGNNSVNADDSPTLRERDQTAPTSSCRGVRFNHRQADMN